MYEGGVAMSTGVLPGEEQLVLPGKGHEQVGSGSGEGEESTSPLVAEHDVHPSSSAADTCARMDSAVTSAW